MILHVNEAYMTRLFFNEIRTHGDSKYGAFKFDDLQYVKIGVFWNMINFILWQIKW